MTTVISEPSESKPVKTLVSVEHQILCALGPIPDLLKVDCKQISSSEYRVNVWVAGKSGDMGFVKTGRIDRSFVARVDENGFVAF